MPEIGRDVLRAGVAAEAHLGFFVALAVAQFRLAGGPRGVVVSRVLPSLLRVRLVPGDDVAATEIFALVVITPARAP